MNKHSPISRRAELPAPPYVAFRTFLGFIERLRTGMPSRVDRSVMNSLSGSNQSQLMAALRYLELISSNGLPTERLSKLVQSDEAKAKANMREVLTLAYPFLFKGFNLQKATFDELTGKFAGAGASGDTVRKCVAFFLAAARNAGLEVSPFVSSRPRLRLRRKARASLGDRGSEDHSRDDGSNEVRTWREMAMSKFPEFDPRWSPELKSKWFDAFDRLMKWMESADKS